MRSVAARLGVFVGRGVGEGLGVFVGVNVMVAVGCGVSVGAGVDVGWGAEKLHADNRLARITNKDKMALTFGVFIFSFSLYIFPIMRLTGCHFKLINCQKLLSGSENLKLLAEQGFSLNSQCFQDSIISIIQIL